MSERHVSRPDLTGSQGVPLGTVNKLLFNNNVSRIKVIFALTCSNYWEALPITTALLFCWHIILAVLVRLFS